MIQQDQASKRSVRALQSHRSNRPQYGTLFTDVDVVSFDLFDTLIHRAGLFSPKDLFYQVQDRAEKRFGMPLGQFAAARTRAEERARVYARGRGQQETTLDEIYGELGRMLGLDADILDGIKEIELECERSALVALDSGLQLFQAALAAGKKVIIVSDTYFDESFISAVTRQLGYEETSHIYVSSRYGKSKVDGHLYDVVLKELGIRPSRLLHVGDNQLADVTMALSRGIRTHFVPTSKHHLKWRHGLGDQLSGNLVMSQILYDHSLVAKAAQASKQSVITQTATQNVSLLYFGYATWLLEQLKSGGYRRVYFAAREGLIMKRCFELVAAAAGFEIDARYLYVSRAALYPSLVFTDPRMARRVFAHSWDHLTIQEALARIGLRFEDCAGVLARHGLADRRLRLEAAIRERFARFLEAIWPQVERTHKEHYQLTIEYMRQELMLNDEKAAFVDVGWHGSLQNALVKMFGHLGIRKGLDGFYLGTFEKPPGAAAEFRSRGYLVDNGGPSSIAHFVRFGPSVIELFHSAGHGSVAGYEHQAGQVRPVLARNIVEEMQFRDIIEPLQNGALEYMAERLALRPQSTLHPPDPGLIARTALRVIYAPTTDEAELFGRLQIASDFGGRMKSITGASEWELSNIEGDVLPDGQIPIWRPGFQVLRKR